MIDSDLLNILVCPESRTRLNVADDVLVARLNEAIRAKSLKNKIGRPLDVPLGGGLIREDKKVLYPIIDGIPVLLIDEGIPLEEVE